jgi:hypothetical protein
MEFTGTFEWLGAPRVELRDADGKLVVPGDSPQAGVSIDRDQNLLTLRTRGHDFRFTLPEGVAAQEGVWGFLSAETGGQPAALRAKFEQKITDSYEFVVNEPCRAWGMCRSKPTDPYTAQYCEGQRPVPYVHEDYVDTLTLELGSPGDATQSLDTFHASGRFVGTHADSGQRKVGTATCVVPLN